MLATKKKKIDRKPVFTTNYNNNKNLHTSSSYAKILGGNKFSASGVSLKGVKSKRRKRRTKKERPKVGDNNGQATHGALKHAWRTQAAWANKQRDITRRPEVMCRSRVLICYTMTFIFSNRLEQAHAHWHCS